MSGLSRAPGVASLKASQRPDESERCGNPEDWREHLGELGQWLRHGGPTRGRGRAVATVRTLAPRRLRGRQPFAPAVLTLQRLSTAVCVLPPPGLEWRQSRTGVRTNSADGWMGVRVDTGQDDDYIERLINKRLKRPGLTLTLRLETGTRCPVARGTARSAETKA